jgi:teichuronic acid biosynthesis glycosyltransferase TuaH
MTVKSWRLIQVWQSLRRLVSDHGALWVISFLLHRTLLRPLTPYFAKHAEGQLKSWYARQTEQVHVYVTALDWHYPYQQRPQHVARELVARRIPVIYVTSAIGYDRTLSTSIEPPGVLLTPHRDVAVRICDRPVVHVLSTDAALDAAFMHLVRSRGGVIVYDYIDAMDDAVSSNKLGPDRMELHRQLLTNEIQSAVLASADVLLSEVAAKRQSDFALVTNGADCGPFIAAKKGATLRGDFAAIVALGKPIIGYYGSLASWFDCNVVNTLAMERPGYSIVIIGPDLDGTRQRLYATCSNLFVLSAMTYTDLPKHAIWFDVCMVPFVINEITLATSPLKIFEYMALGKPTVSTNLPECRKYRSITIGGVPGDNSFATAVDLALKQSQEPSFAAMAQAEGQENSWTAKVDEILALIRSFRDHEATVLAPGDTTPLTARLSEPNVVPVRQTTGPE